MKQQLTSKKSGFTIIEVVLVLAIAALIFLLVFLAFPALQRNQRDTQRRNDLGRFVSQMSQYQTNNNGQIVDSALELPGFITTYLLNSGSDEWADPSEGAYTAEYRAGGTDGGSTLSIGVVRYHYQAVCNGESATGTGAGERNFAVRTKLEAGGHYCQDNR